MQHPFKKLQKLSHEHLRDIAMLSGSVAVLLVVAAFIAVGGFSRLNSTLALLNPKEQSASVQATQIGSIVYSMSFYVFTGGGLSGSSGNGDPTQVNSVTVTPGSSVTFYWEAYHYSGNTFYPTCAGSVYGDDYACNITSGTPHYSSGCTVIKSGTQGDCGNVVGPGGSLNGSTYTVNPPLGVTNYYFCSNYLHSQAGFGCQVITVTVAGPPPPTPTTLTSFTATPSSIVGSGSSRLDWVGVKGTNYNACALTGGQYGVIGTSATWFGSLPGAVNTNSLTQTTTYEVDCIDTDGASTGWHVATVTVSAPPSSCANGLNYASYGPGCTCPSGQVQSGSSCVAAPPSSCANGLNINSYPSCTCPSGQQQSGSSCVANPLCANGLNNSYAPSCKCPAGQYQPLGASSCVALPVCANGLSQAYSPSCTCPAGQVQSGSSCVVAGSITNFSATPNRVQKGRTTTVSWATSHMSTCTLSQFSTAGTVTLSSSATSGSLTPTINSQTIFTLSCTDAADEAISASQTVNVIPTVIEQ